MPDFLAAPSQIAGVAVIIVCIGILARIGWELGGRAFTWLRSGIGMHSRFTLYKAHDGGQWVVDDNSRIIRVDLPGDRRP
jgi:hypothetical protein